MYVLTLSLLATTFSCLLVMFANSLDPDQDRQNISPDLNPNQLTLKEFFEKRTKKADDKKAQKITLPAKT